MSERSSPVTIDPAELWERYLEEVRADRGKPSPQGAMAFAVDALASLQSATPAGEHAAWLDNIEQRLNESGTGEMGLLDTIHAVAALVRDARASLQPPTAVYDGPTVTSDTAPKARWFKPAADAVAGDPIAERLVDWVYLHATEGQQWPSTKTKSTLIARAMEGEPTQDDADGMKAAANNAGAVAGDAKAKLESFLDEYWPGWRTVYATLRSDAAGGVTSGAATARDSNAASLSEKLIQAAVDYESGRCSQRELSEARAAVEASICAHAATLTETKDQLFEKIYEVARAWKGANGGIYTIRGMCLELLEKVFLPRVTSGAATARDSVIEECAAVCDKHAEWTETHIDDDPESTKSQIFATISNTANDCAEMVRDLKGQRVPKVRTSHHRNKEEAARLQALVDKRYARARDAAQPASETVIADAIRDHFKSIGNSPVVSSDGVERVYYSGFSLIKLTKAIALAMTSTQSDAASPFGEPVGYGDDYPPITD